MLDPSTWRSVKIREIAKILSGGTPSRTSPGSWNGNIPWLTPGELTGKSERVVSKTAECISAEGLRSSGCVLLPKGTLMVTSRATLGECAVAGAEMTTNQGFKNLILDTEFADPHFYYYALNSMRGELIRHASGTTFLEVSASEFGELIVPLPPLEDQRRIVEILESVADSDRAERKAIAKLATIKQAFIDERTKSAYGWIAEPLGRRLIGIEAGRSPDLPNKPAPPGEWGVLKVSAIHSAGFRPHENKHAPEPSSTARKFEIFPGDLLFSRANTPELVGASCIAAPSPARLMLSDKTLRLQEDPRSAVREFISIALNANIARRQIANLASGTSRSMQNISQDSVAKIELRWPSVAEQRKFVEHVQAMDDLIGFHQAQSEKLRSLSHGLLHHVLPQVHTTSSPHTPSRS